MDRHRNGLSLDEIRRGPLQVFSPLERLDVGAAAEDLRGVAVEHLRLHVPAGRQQAWLDAEQQTWDPWLRQQSGFLGREVLWDSASEEGVLLIHWATRRNWNAIPAQAVAATQASFEAAAKAILGLPSHSENPFPLVFAGEARLP